MINKLIENYGWIQTIDGYSLSELHPFYVEEIFGGVRVIWENNNLDFYEVGRLYGALNFHGLLMGLDWGRYEEVSIKLRKRIYPPPHSPTPHNDTPLVEAATTGGEITVENMRNEGWIIIEKYSRVYRDPVMISPCENFKFYFVQMGNGWLSCRQGELRPNITTMTELRTLIKWLS